MHYKDGTPANLGDVVRGKGYNVKYEIQGVVVNLNPGEETCNISVAHAVPATRELQGFVHQTAGYHQDPVDPNLQTVSIGLATISIEHGQTDAFEKIA
jgi:hypothetical protein